MSPVGGRGLQEGLLTGCLLVAIHPLLLAPRVHTEQTLGKMAWVGVEGLSYRSFLGGPG